jgi:hypothetical protein
MRGILLTREDYIAFLQKKAIQAYISQSYQEHNYTSHEHHKQSHNLVLAYHGDQIIWEKHISMAYDTNAVYDTKMQTYKHDMIHKWECNMHMYTNPPNRSSKGKNDSKLSSQTRKCSLVQGLG